MNHIVYADLQDFASHYNALFAAATPERQQRAASCREDVALRCLVSGALLAYAAKQEGISAYTVAENPFGKPFLETHPDFHFNLTHAGHYAAIVWGQSPVGIDLEIPRYRDAIARLTKRHFTPAEQEYAADTARFYEIWTAKESYLKFLGTGINRPLDSFCTRSPEIRALLHPFFPEEDCCLTVCAEDSCAAPLRIKAEDLLK